jgi:hypothetical protein
MARRVRAKEVFGFAWQEPPPRPAPVDPPRTRDLEATLRTTPRTKALIAKLRSHLAKHPAGLSFTKLRAASGLPADDVRSALDAALRAGLIRRVGAQSSLVYLTNPDTTPG